MLSPDPKDTRNSEMGEISMDTGERKLGRGWNVGVWPVGGTWIKEGQQEGFCQSAQLQQRQKDRKELWERSGRKVTSLEQSASWEKQFMWLDQSEGARIRQGLWGQEPLLGTWSRDGEWGATNTWSPESRQDTLNEGQLVSHSVSIFSYFSQWGASHHHE